MSFLTMLPRSLYKPHAFKGFKPGLSDFDMGVAHAMAWMCQLAYETVDKSKIESVAGEWKPLIIPANGIISKDVVTVLPMSSTQLIVGVCDGAAIIAFAGTDPLALVDWITDFDIRRTKAGMANGFATAAQSVWNEIDALFQAPPFQGLPVFLTGHSLGGALAVLTAQHINISRPGTVRAVYTFGMPRTGDDSFKSGYNPVLGSRTYRLVHADDLVPTVPPSFLQNARHVGRMLRCDRLKRFGAQAPASMDSDDPQFVDGITKELTALNLGPLSGVMSATHRAKLVAALVLGMGPAGMRTDPAGILIETLPPRLRDHMPDRYIAATT